MPPTPTARILAVGDELTLGDLPDTNSAFLARRCRQIGLTVLGSATVRDRVDEIAHAVRTAAADTRVCLIGGGLGPTTDDRTAEAVARAAGVGLERIPRALAAIEARFRELGRPMPAANHKQADLPAGSEPIDNPHGTAPGFRLDLGTCSVFCMPGVPRELEAMMREQIEPRLRERLELQPVARRIYRTLGRGESSLAEDVEPVVERMRARSPGLAASYLHYRASYPEVVVTLEGTPGPAGERAGAEELAELDAPLRQAIGEALYGIGEAGLAERLLAALVGHDLRIAVAESCTGGGIAARLAAVPGASAALLGGVVAYDDEIKRRELAVGSDDLREHGAVSEVVARAMAEGVRARLGSDLGIASTGIAGPSGGTAEKPVGTVHLAVADASGTTHLRLRLRGNRGMVQQATASWAMKLAWDRLVARGQARVEARDE